MDYKVTYHDAEEYVELARDWKRVVARHESGTWIFRPLASVRYLARQFVLDNNSDGILAVDCLLDKAAYSDDEVATMLLAALRQSAHPVFEEVDAFDTAVTRLQAGSPTKLVLLVHGLDTAVRAGDTTALSYLNRLALKYPTISVLLLLCTDITDPSFASGFARYAVLNQNIAVVPRKGGAEGESFFHSLETLWGVRLSDEQRRWVEDNTDWSLRFIKEVYRQVERNPDLTYDELFTVPALEYKAQALLDNFLESQRDVILRVVFDEPIPTELNHALQYLLTIRWLHKREGDGKLALTVPYIDWYIRNREAPASGSAKQKLSPNEAAALAVLEAKQGMVVSRDELADGIWKDQAAEKYSDWAIDQIIHRLRRKTAGDHQRAQIEVERGRGFILR